MKKICFVAEYMYCGGTEKSLLSLLRYLDREKYQITLLLMKKKGDLLPQLPDDITVREIPLPEDEAEDLLNGRGNALKEAVKSGHIIKAAGKALRGIRMALETRNGAEKRLWYYKSIEKKIPAYPEEFDVVIDYMGYGLFNTFYAACKVNGRVKISWVHFEPNQAMPDFGAFRELLGEYRHIMCVSENSRRQMEEMIPELKDRYQVFYNIVDGESLWQQARGAEIPKNPGEISITSVGRLDPQKGFDIAIGAVARLRAEGYPVKWRIVGEGWQRQALEAQIAQSDAAQESVVLEGQKLNPYPYIAMCDIYFQPSRHEGYGIAVAEARAFYKPIVATNFAGAREQLVHGQTGIITQCTEECLYLALKQLLDDPALRNSLSENLRKQQQTWPEQVRILETIMDSA